MNSFIIDYVPSTILRHKALSSVSICLLNALRLKIRWVSIEWDFFTCEITFTVGNQEFFSVFGV